MLILGAGNWNRRPAGFTLLELLVAIALVGLLLGITIPMIGDVMDLRIKGSARRLAATIGYLYAKAATERLTVRLVYDLDKQSYWAESSRDRVLLVREDAAERAERLEKEARAQEESGGVEGEEPAAQPGPEFAAEEGYLLKPRELPPDVRFKDIYAVHQKEPVTGGQAYTYFFPSGMVEWSIINITDHGEHVNYSLEVAPITGRVTIRKNYLDYREAEQEALRAE